MPDHKAVLMVQGKVLLLPPSFQEGVGGRFFSFSPSFWEGAGGRFFVPGPPPTNQTPATARHNFKYHVHVFYLVYLISGVLCIWGGCLIARVIANRLELGLFRRKQRRSLSPDAALPAVPPTKRRSSLWVIAAVVAMVIGTGASFLASGASELSGPMFGGRGGWPESLVFSLEIASLGLAAGLVLVGFRFDPHLGRRRCPKCWYDLSATKGLLCPECGHEASSERRLYRTRRSRAAIALGVLPLLLLPIVPRVIYAYRVGWVGLIPTTVMVLGWDTLPDSVIGMNQTAGGWVSPRLGTLAQRLGEGDPWEWQLAILKWRCQSVCANSNDPKAIVRAMRILQDAGPTPDLANSINRQLPAFLKRISDPDPEIRAAVAYLVSWHVFSDPNWGQDNRDPLLQNILQAKASLVELATGSNLDASFEAIQLLGRPAFAETLDATDVAALEAVFSNTQANSWQRLSMAYAFSASPNPLVIDMLVRFLDAKSVSSQGQLAGIIFARSLDPKITHRVLQAIQSGDPALAVIAAQSVRDRVDAHAAELRIAALTRFSQDQFTNPAFWGVLNNYFPAGSIPDHDLELLRPGVFSALNSKDGPSVLQALGFLARNTDQSPQVREALDAFISTLEKDSPLASNARAIRDKLFPPDPK